MKIMWLSALLHVPLCTGPKYPFYIGELIIHSFPKETHHFRRFFLEISFREECMPVKLELYTILTMWSFSSHSKDHLTKSEGPYVRVSVTGAPGRLMLYFF